MKYYFSNAKHVFRFNMTIPDPDVGMGIETAVNVGSSSDVDMKRSQALRQLVSSWSWRFVLYTWYSVM